MGLRTMKVRPCTRRGFFLLETMIALMVLMVVVGAGLQAMLAGYLELQWTSKISLADAWLDREAAVLRRLSPAELQDRGYLVGTETSTLNVPLSYVKVGGAYVAEITAAKVKRSATSLGNGAILYEVELVFETGAGRPDYAKSRKATRTFSIF